METAAFLNHEEQVAEANARSLGEVKTANLWVEPEPQPDPKEADA